jgi:hypothetical protein
MTRTAHGGPVQRVRAIWDREMTSSGPQLGIDEGGDCPALSGRVVVGADYWGVGWLATL